MKLKKTIDMTAQDHAYRMEGRNHLDCYAEILEGTKFERKLIEKYARILKRVTGKKPTIQSNGCDNGGRLLRWYEVSTEPDYIVNGKLLEVKSSAIHSPVLHLKADQVEKYVKRHKCDVLFVNGAKTDNPVYTIITVDELRHILENFTPQAKGKWAGKEIFKVRQDRFTWKPFK
jgi:hypothetical protein